MSQVFQVLLKWTDGLKSGLGPEDVVYLKKSLKKAEFTVLPTVQDKWVSLHRSFGIVCWCDDKKFKKHFKHVDGIEFLFFGKLSKDEKETLQTKVSILMRTLGIPALSEVRSFLFMSMFPIHRDIAALSCRYYFAIVLYYIFFCFSFIATLVQRSG